MSGDGFELEMQVLDVGQQLADVGELGAARRAPAAKFFVQLPVCKAFIVMPVSVGSPM